MNSFKAKTQMYLRQMNANLKPRRRKLLRDRSKSNAKSNIPTLKQADEIEKTLSSFHKRVKQKKKKHLFDLFAQNITMFQRLNSQKSIYQQLFSKNKQNRQVRQSKQTRRKLKRCTSAHVNRTKTFDDEYNEYRESYFMKRKRPFSSHSSKNQIKTLTIQSQF